MDYSIDSLHNVIKYMWHCHVRNLDKFELPRFDLGGILLGEKMGRLLDGSNDGGYAMALGKQLGEYACPEATSAASQKNRVERHFSVRLCQLVL